MALVSKAHYSRKDIRCDGTVVTLEVFVSYLGGHNKGILKEEQKGFQRGY